MENVELLLKYNSYFCNTKNIKLSNGKIIYTNRDRIFDGNKIKQLIGWINALNRKYPKSKIPIIFNMGQIEFVDKLTYVFFEILCYILMKEYKHKVIVHFSTQPNIFTEGIAVSPLEELFSQDKTQAAKFFRRFDDEIYLNHYRRILHRTNNNVELSKKMDEITYFFSFFDIEETYLDELAEVFAELIGNAWEHASNECLVDIDVTKLYQKRQAEGQYLGINIAVLNFSNELLGNAIKERLTSDNDLLPERYEQVRKAYENHKKFMDGSYLEEDFFNIAAFQHKVSGRKDKILTGGTGLTKLIASLENRSDAHNCYFITGNRGLVFKHEYLGYNDDGWIGFNKENNFFSKSPDINNICQNAIFMPGTAYNLNFVIKRREQKWISTQYD